MTGWSAMHKILGHGEAETSSSRMIMLTVTWRDSSRGRIQQETDGAMIKGRHGLCDFPGEINPMPQPHLLA